MYILACCLTSQVLCWRSLCVVVVRTLLCFLIMCYSKALSSNWKANIVRHVSGIYVSLLYIYMQYCSVCFWSSFVVVTDWCPSVKTVSFTRVMTSPTVLLANQWHNSDTSPSLKGVLGERQRWQCWLMRFILQTCLKMLLMCAWVNGAAK